MIPSMSKGHTLARKPAHFIFLHKILLASDIAKPLATQHKEDFVALPPNVAPCSLFGSHRKIHPQSSCTPQQWSKQNIVAPELKHNHPRSHIIRFITKVVPACCLPPAASNV